MMGYVYLLQQLHLCETYADVDPAMHVPYAGMN